MRSNQSILKEINLEYSLEVLKLKLDSSTLATDEKSNLSGKTLMLGKIEDKRRRQQRMIYLDGITNSMDMNLTKLREIVKDRDAWHAAVHGVTKGRTRLRE